MSEPPSGPSPLPDVVSRFVEISSPEERRRFARGRPALLDRATVALLCDESVGLLRVDLDRAERLSEAAADLSALIGDDFSRGRVLRAQANVLNFRRAYEEAARRYEEAIESLERAGETKEAAITRSSGIVSLISVGRHEQAARWLREARRVFERTGDRLRLARLEFAAGNLKARQDRFHEALEHFHAAHGEFEASGRPYDVGMSLRNIAVCLQEMNELAAAEAAYSRAREYCREQGLPLLVLEIDYNVAYLFFLRGEYTRALAAYGAAREACDRENDPHHRALCDLDEAEILLELNLAEDAARTAREAHDGFSRLGMGYEAAKALTLQALATAGRGREDEALDLLLGARRIFVDEGNAIWPWRIDLLRGQILYGQARLEEAAALAGPAHDALAGARQPVQTAIALVLLARLDLAAGDPERARERCREVIELASGLRVPALRFRAELLRGQAEESLGDPGAALEAYERSAGLLDQMRVELRSDELRIAFQEDKQAVYEGLVWLILTEGEGSVDANRAFATIEKAKSRSLADLLERGAEAIPARSAAGGRAAERVQELRQRVRICHRRIDREELRQGPGASRRLDALRLEGREAERELLRQLRRARLADPEYGSLHSATAVEAERVRSLLPPDSTILELFAARGVFFGCVVDRAGLEVVRLGEVDSVRRLESRLRFQLGKLLTRDPALDRAPEHLTRSTREVLESLYRELIGPVRARLTGRHLVVVPHGFLHHLPFHALADGGRHLIEEFSISFAPSSSVLHYCSSRGSAGDGPPLVLGVPDERAPLIEEEARAVAASLPGSRLLLGSEASEANLRRLGTRARIVHVATHGMFRRDNPLFSAIRLGTGRLSVVDLYGLKLDAELMVLSGCGTGLGVISGGDEQVGLTRGLLYAGARSLLVTLWDVNDRSTTRFMKALYRALGSGQPPAAALREAMLESRRHHPHPFTWAPFVLVGAPDAPAGAG